MTDEILAAAGLKRALWEEGPSPIHYLTRGGPDPTLVCLHGLGDSSLTFPEFAGTDPLRRYRVVAPDCPGFGRSPRFEPAAWSLRGLAQSVLTLLDALDVGGFVILGHSLGGAVAVHLARLAPFRCAGILSLEGNLTLAAMRHGGTRWRLVSFRRARPGNRENSATWRAFP
jgi:pyruvate dehydrogenase E2 component (dihydrolipoamide acetyltransferase)